MNFLPPSLTSFAFSVSLSFFLSLFYACWNNSFSEGCTEKGFGVGGLMPMTTGRDSLTNAFHSMVLWVRSVVGRVGQSMNLALPAQSCEYLGEELFQKESPESSLTVLENVFVLIQVYLWCFHYKPYIPTFHTVLHIFLC